MWSSFTDTQNTSSARRIGSSSTTMEIASGGFSEGILSTSQPTFHVFGVYHVTCL